MKRELEKNKNKLGENAVIRIDKDEYKNIPDSLFAHFNLECCKHEVGKIYSLPKIIKRGYFKESTQEEVLPELDFIDGLKAKCIDVQEKIAYEDLAEKYFEHSMVHIKSKEQLKDIIWKRYHQSLPEVSKKEMMKLGVSWTLLEII